MDDDVIHMPNEPTVREEYGIRWDWRAGHRSYAGPFPRESIARFLKDPPQRGMHGCEVRRTITTSEWTEA